MMISIILTTLAALPSQDGLGAVNPQDCKDMIVALLRRNRTLDKSDVGYEDIDTAQPKLIAFSGGKVSFSVGESFGGFDTLTGLAAYVRLQNKGVADARKVDKGAEISEEASEQAVREVLSILHWPHQVKFVGSILNRHKETAYYNVFATPMTGDRSLSPDYQIQADIDASAGQLITIWLPRYPDLEFANDKILDEPELKTKSWEAYEKFQPYDDGVVQEARLVLEPPRYQRPHFLNQEYIDLGNRWKAIPIWRTLIVHKDDLGKTEIMHNQVVHLDARVGKVLKIDVE